MFRPNQQVQHDGRPAVIITAPDTGATGSTLYGIRYMDVPQWESDPSFPNMQRPTRGSCAIAHAEDLS